MGPAASRGLGEDLTVGMSFVASFETVGKLLGKIEQYPGHVCVNQVVMRQMAAAQAGSIQVTMELQARLNQEGNEQLEALGAP
jgi:hypothetical protein